MGLIYGCGNVIRLVILFLSAFFVNPETLGWQSSPALQLVIMVIGGAVAGAVVGIVPRSWLQIRAGWTTAWLRAMVVSWGCVAAVWWIEYQALGGTEFEIGSQDVVPAILITGVLTGVTLGAVQWIIMSRYIKISPLWILTTTASWLVGALVVAFVLPIFDFGILTYLVWLVIFGAIVGLGTGLAQGKLIHEGTV